MTTTTKEEILNTAKLVVQAHGYNALSFRVISAMVGVKSASMHYHFPTKGDLGAALARQYTEDGMAYLDNLCAKTKDVSARMKGYTDIFRAPLENDNRMCLVGIMTAEYEDLPAQVRVEVNNFNDANINWLSKMLADQMPDKPETDIQKQALAIFAAVEGAQLIARGRADPTVFDQAIDAFRASKLIP